MKKKFIFIALISVIGLSAVSCSSDDLDMHGTSINKVVQVKTEHYNNFRSTQQ